jgi:hypothetical protein
MKSYQNSELVQKIPQNQTEKKQKSRSHLKMLHRFLVKGLNENPYNSHVRALLKKKLQ